MLKCCTCQAQWNACFYDSSCRKGSSVPGPDEFGVRASVGGREWDSGNPWVTRKLYTIAMYALNPHSSQQIKTSNSNASIVRCKQTHSAFRIKEQFRIIRECDKGSHRHGNQPVKCSSPNDIHCFLCMWRKQCQ